MRDHATYPSTFLTYLYAAFDDQTLNLMDEVCSVRVTPCKPGNEKGSEAEKGCHNLATLVRTDRQICLCFVIARWFDRRSIPSNRDLSSLSRQEIRAATAAAIHKSLSFPLGASIDDVQKDGEGGS